MAVFGDKRAMKELLLLGGSDAERERQITASRGAAANRAKTAVHDALSLLVVRHSKRLCVCAFISGKRRSTQATKEADLNASVADSQP